jgi:hypothetical protein
MRNWLSDSWIGIRTATLRIRAKNNMEIWRFME